MTGGKTLFMVCQPFFSTKILKFNFHADIPKIELLNYGNY